MGNFVYSLCGVAVGFTCQEPRQSQRLQRLWDRMFVLERVCSPAPDVYYTFQTSNQPIKKPKEMGLVKASSEHLSVRRTDAGYDLLTDSAILHIDTQNGSCTGMINQDFWEQPLEYQRELFMLSFLMLLRPHGRYGLHANAIANDDQGFLIIGPACSGKTTLTLVMIRSGWKFLSDDAIMLQATPDGIYAHALRRGLSCTPQTLARFPELKSSADESPTISDGKKLLDIETRYPDSYTPRITPKVLLFPEVTTGHTSRLFPLSDMQAIIALVEQSPGIMTDHVWVQKQMEVLKKLTGQALSYRLSLGDDIFNTPQKVISLLKSIERGLYG
ncbi:hypothetical protein ACFLXI_00395 [Chloroflexota bacterium]